MSDPNQVTRLLAQLRQGDESVADQLLPLVHAELRDLAGAVFSGQNPGHTLQPTALVNEAWMKLAGNLAPIEDRRHFLVVAGKAMRHVLTDHARARRSDKRGGGQGRVTLDTNLAAGAEGSPVDLLDLEESLANLSDHNERLARVAELRIFSGLTIDETAEALGMSCRSIDSDWALAKAWLRRDLSRGD